jgi:tetratricopeptide (TPR) repeat protein
MVKRLRKLRESFLPLLSLLVGLLGVALIMDAHAEKIVEDYTVLPVTASSETWQAGRMDDDGMDNGESAFAPDLDAVSKETAEARALSDKGRFDLAEVVLLETSAKDPGNPILLNELGVTSLRLSKKKEALSAFTKAIEMRPDYFRAYYNRAITYQRLGDDKSAESDYKTASTLHPNHFESKYNLGLLQLKRGAYQEAADSLDEAVKQSSGTSRAQALFSSARVLSKLGKKAEAIRRYKKSIEYQPDYVLPRFNLAMMLYSSKDNEERRTAQKYLDEILSLRPDFAPAYFLLGRIAAKEGDKATAAKWYETAIKTDSGFFKAKYNLGLTYLQEDRLPEAKRIFLAIMEENKDKPEILFNLGKVEYAEGNFDTAKRYYEEAAAKSSGNYPEAELNLGIVLKAKGSFDESLAAFDSLLAKKKDWSPALLNKALVLMELKRYGEAESAIMQAEQAGMEKLKVYFNLGVILAAQDRYDEAALAYQKALAADPRHVKSLVNLGFALGRTGKFKEAESVYRKAVALSPSYTSARLNLASALRKQNKWEEAAAEYQAVIALDETDESAWNNLGVCLAKLGKTKDAVEAFQQVLELDPSDVKARYNFALQLKKQGNLDESEAEMRRVLKLNPDHFQSLVSLADILGGKNRLGEASDFIDRALRLRPEDKDALAIAQKYQAGR